MGICDKCKRLCPSTKMRQGDDPLCDECEAKRVATLAREQQQRKLRSFSTRAADGETPATNTNFTPDAIDEPPRDGQPSVDGTSAHSETPPTHSPDVYCLEHCHHGRSGDGHMIRCCMCFRWHHEQCVADGSIRQDTPWWLCPSCRSLPDTVRVISKTIQSLQQSMNNVLASNNALVNPVKDLTVKNEQLLAQISSLSCDRSKLLSSSNTYVPNLLIGASTVRDIACTDPSALYIISRGGAKTGDVLKILKDTNTEAYADVTIHVGTNNCATKFSVDKIANNIREISNQAKRVSRSGCVTFSSITPRIDNPAAAEKGLAVNEQMQSIAEETGCLFVSNQDNFLCRNGDINEELLSIDGLHLSKLCNRTPDQQPETGQDNVLPHRSDTATWRRTPAPPVVSRSCKIGTCTGQSNTTQNWLPCTVLPAHRWSGFRQADAPQPKTAAVTWQGMAAVETVEPSFYQTRNFC